MASTPREKGHGADSGRGWDRIGEEHQERISHRNARGGEEMADLESGTQGYTGKQKQHCRWVLIQRMQWMGPLHERFLPSASLQPNRNDQSSTLNVSLRRRPQ